MAPGIVEPPGSPSNTPRRFEGAAEALYVQTTVMTGMSISGKMSVRIPAIAVSPSTMISKAMTANV
jgi:hypothetical protein